MGGEVDLAAAQGGQPGPVAVGGRAQHVRRAADEHGAVRDDGAGRDESALAEDAAVTQPRAGHEDRPVADLAEIPDAGSDDGGAVAEDRALPDLDRLSRLADEDAVLQNGRVVAEPDVPGPGSQHHTLCQQRARADMRLPDQDRRGGDLAGGLLGSRTVEAHRIRPFIRARPWSGSRSRRAPPW